MQTDVREVKKVELIDQLENEHSFKTDLKVSENLPKYINNPYIPVFHDFEFGTKNENNVSMHTIRSTIISCIKMNTETFKEEMPYREGTMLKELEAIVVHDHKNGYVTIDLLSSVLDYTVELLVTEPQRKMRRGTITG